MDPKQPHASESRRSTRPNPLDQARDETDRRVLTDLGFPDRPLTTSELARAIGMSPTFVRDEIRCGHLRAAAVGRGRKRVFRITVREALRYAKALGLL